MNRNYIGQRFGDYKLTEVLGTGGFATVYKGENVHDKKLLAAVKIFNEQQVDDFVNEIRRTVFLKDAHIINVLDFGIKKPDNIGFIVMDYAPHDSLAQKYPRGTQVELVTVVAYVQQIASALQYAYDKNVIHRDVKPPNLLLDAQDNVLLSDFGIAMGRATSNTYANQATQGIGTLAYMAPEQFRGRAEFASDQYALALIVYEWLCGELPFYGNDYISWSLLHQQEEPPPLCSKVPTLARDVEKVILKALAKDPKARFSRIADFTTELSKATGIEPSLPTKPQRLPPLANASIETLYQDAIKAQASGDVPTAYRIWQQITATSNAANTTYVTSATKRLQELRGSFINYLIEQARDAHNKGQWQDEIATWEELLKLEPAENETQKIVIVPTHVVEDNEWEDLEYYSPVQPKQKTPNKHIQTRIEIAKQNAEYAWMYANAQQFLSESNTEAAQTQLQILWKDAPYYGDPKKLAQKVTIYGIGNVGLNYEQRLENTQKQQQNPQISPSLYPRLYGERRRDTPASRNNANLPPIENNFLEPQRFPSGRQKPQPARRTPENTITLGKLLIAVLVGIFLASISDYVFLYVFHVGDFWSITILVFFGALAVFLFLF